VIDPNVYQPEWEHELKDPPFRTRSMRIGSRSGASELGVSLFEVDPGGAVAPYHIHHGNEELLLVLSGTPQLRTPDGVRTLEAGAMVAFPRGPAGAHRIANHSTEPVRLLIFSTMNFPEVGEHPDTGTWLALTGPMDGKVFPAGAHAPDIESVLRAIRAATEHEPPGD
jgi:uncharacterized cupin superfamily protein